jgi:alginate O-acetyltransferase complex protein AlgI
VIGRILLPIGISFFTFQKIAFLIDNYRGEAKQRDFLEFCLFVMFFPQLIAGPIVHYSEVMPQFAKARLEPASERLAVGLTILVIGLIKKVGIADAMAVPAATLFDGVVQGHQPALTESWVGTLSYAFQIYFDFSGYSDMAVGLGWMFGIRLPINFASPYKAASITEFWQRWHITLSRFLKAYSICRWAAIAGAFRAPMSTCSSPCCSAASGTGRRGPSCSGVRSMAAC